MLEQGCYSPCPGVRLSWSPPVLGSASPGESESWGFDTSHNIQLSYAKAVLTQLTICLKTGKATNRGYFNTGVADGGENFCPYPGSARPAMGTIVSNMNRIALTVAEIQRRKVALRPVGLTWLTFMTSPMAAKSNVACHQNCIDQPAFSRIFSRIRVTMVVVHDITNGLCLSCAKIYFLGWYNFTLR